MSNEKRPTRTVFEYHASIPAEANTRHVEYLEGLARDGAWQNLIKSFPYDQLIRISKEEELAPNPNVLPPGAAFRYTYRLIVEQIEEQEDSGT